MYYRSETVTIHEEESVPLKTRRMSIALFICLIVIIGSALMIVSEKLPGRIFVHQYVDGVSSKTVALTIDDGPDATYTPEILDILKAHGAHATFFLVGEQAAALPDLVHREIAEGHEVGNHTMTHRGWLDMSVSDALSEITQAQDTITSIAGQAPVFFRPPRGENTNATAEAIKESNLPLAMWTIGVEHHDSGSAQAEADRVAAAVGPGTIILAHDGRLNRSETVDALRILLDELDAQGYRVVTLSELLSEGSGFARTW